VQKVFKGGNYSRAETIWGNTVVNLKEIKAGVTFSVKYFWRRSFERSFHPQAPCFQTIFWKVYCIQQFDNFFLYIQKKFFQSDKQLAREYFLAISEIYLQNRFKTLKFFPCSFKKIGKRVYSIQQFDKFFVIIPKKINFSLMSNWRVNFF